MLTQIYEARLILCIFLPKRTPKFTPYLQKLSKFYSYSRVHVKKIHLEK